MSLAIHINLPDGDVSREALAVHMSALGFGSSTSAVAIAAAAPKSEPVIVTGDTEVQSGGTKPRATRKKTETAQISTGENRVGPEDDADTQEQDKADEAAEVEQNRDPEKTLTLDDVKAAVGAYVAKFDMAAAQQDGPQLFVDILGKPPEGEAYWKMSILPSDQANLKKVVDGWTKAAASATRYGA